MSDTPINVLHVYRTYFPDTQGGAEEVIRQICRNSVDHDIESRVFTPSRHPKNVLVDETRVVQVKLNFEIASCGFCLTGLKEFKRQVDWADVVHYHFPWPFADIMHLYASHNKPSLMTYHSDIVRQQNLLNIYRPLMCRFLESMDHIVATSSNYQLSSNVLAMYEDKVSAIPLGIDEDSYPDLDGNILNECQEKYGEGFFFFIGVLRYYKGLHLLIDACKNARFEVVIAGAGPLEKALKAQVRKLGLSNVKFAGRISDEEKMAMYHLCRGVVFSSHVRSEAFGITLVEGLMCSKPLITAETGTGTSFVNSHKETGLVVKANDSTALHEAMTTLIDDPDMAKNMGRRGRQRYELLLTGKQMGLSYAHLYRKLHADGRKP
ncbi:MAG: glycosyltransferase involved in cell wall biosynthesis [Flavobacterium sp.]